MNSEFVARQARSLAGQMLGDSALNDAGRIVRTYLRVLGRPAQEPEVQRGARVHPAFPASPNDQAGRLLAWTSFCRALIASNEFLYIR